MASMPSLLLLLVIINSSIYSIHVLSSQLGHEDEEGLQVKGLSWKSTCPKLESIVRKQLVKVFKKDISLAPALLRLHFHDCFVQVCDSLVLLDGSASGPMDSEKTAPPNLSFGGPNYNVPLGRRDGLSFASGNATLANLPSLFATTATILTTLAAKNFDTTNDVALFGAHTLGVTHCISFMQRLYPT